MGKQIDAAVLKAARALLASQGGKARAKSMTAAERRESARAAGQASAAKRWGTKAKNRKGGR
jgi:hypothetical protein